MCVRAAMRGFVYLYIFVFEDVRSIMALNLSLLFQFNREAHRLRSVSYCELIILCWNCVRVCMCVLAPVGVWCVCTFVIAKEMTEQSIISHLPHPDLIFLNALTPWLLLMHLQCQSHSFELQRWRETDRGGWGGGLGVACGPGVRVQGGYFSLFVALCLLKKNLKCSYVHWKATACWILKYLWHHCFFFSCVCTSCKQSRSCFHGNIYLCEEFINPFS